MATRMRSAATARRSTSLISQLVAASSVVVSVPKPRPSSLKMSPKQDAGMADYQQVLHRMRCILSHTL